MKILHIPTATEHTWSNLNYDIPFNGMSETMLIFTWVSHGEHRAEYSAYNSSARGRDANNRVHRPKYEFIVVEE